MMLQRVAYLGLALLMPAVGCKNENPRGTSLPQPDAVSPQLSGPMPQENLERLIGGSLDLSREAREELRLAVDEDNKAGDRKLAAQERLIVSVHTARHQKQALQHYQRALELIPTDQIKLRRQVTIKIEILKLSIDLMGDMNNLLPASSRG